jgi:hypothetical protein
MALRQLESLHHHAPREGDAAAIAALLDPGLAAAVVVVVLARVALGAVLEPGVRAGVARPTREAAWPSATAIARAINTVFVRMGFFSSSCAADSRCGARKAR